MNHCRRCCGSGSAGSGHCAKCKARLPGTPGQRSPQPLQKGKEMKGFKPNPSYHISKGILLEASSNSQLIKPRVSETHFFDYLHFCKTRLMVLTAFAMLFFSSGFFGATDSSRFFARVNSDSIRFSLSS